MKLAVAFNRKKGFAAGSLRWLTSLNLMRMTKMDIFAAPIACGIMGGAEVR